MRPIRVLLADDHPVFLDGLRTLVTGTADLAVVATAATGSEAIARALEQRPGVVVLEITLPRTDGLTAAREIAAVSPEIAVLIVTARHGEEDVRAAMAAGAAGYVTKDAEPGEIITAIRVVARGGLFFNAAIAPQVRRRLGTSPAAPAFPQLTCREQEVLELLVRDIGTAVIARQLGITMKTVRNHVSNILVKLPARTRAEAARVARDAGQRFPRPAEPASRGTWVPVT